MYEIFEPFDKPHISAIYRDYCNRFVTFYRIGITLAT